MRALGLGQGLKPVGDFVETFIAAVVLPDLLRARPEAAEAGRRELQRVAESADPELARAAQLALLRLGDPAP